MGLENGFYMYFTSPVGFDTVCFSPVCKGGYGSLLQQWVGHAGILLCVGFMCLTYHTKLSRHGLPRTSRKDKC
jgi:hypothetical protein